uniref:MADS-box domain-containing protein n=1 Tax=Oryza punctata TaxID=4537 RepID=A0A0E0LBZ0_ORYPU
MVHPRGRPSKGRQVIEIRRIEDKPRRQVTFTKRRTGLFKKASELSILTGASVAVVVFSEAKRLYAFAEPSLDAVLRCYAPAPVHDYEPEALRRAADEAKAEVAAEEARLRDVAGKITQAMAAGRRFWWEAEVDALGEAELPEFVRALGKLRGAVERRRSDAMLSAQLPKQP